MLLKVLHSICQQIWKTQQWPQDWKGQFSFQLQRKAMPKNAQTTAQLQSSQANRLILKILQDRLQQYVNCELPDVQAWFRKGRRAGDQIANIRWTIKKARKFQEKHLLLLYWLHQSLWLCRSQQTVKNSERNGNTRLPSLPPEKSVRRLGSNR